MLLGVKCIDYKDLTKLPRREHTTTPILKKCNGSKFRTESYIQSDAYTSYYNIAPSYLCELINKKVM